MELEILPSFIKDLKKIKHDAMYSHIKTFTFETLPSFDTFREILNVKKIKEDYYRTRIGDYRIGFRYQNNTITLMRVLHRKDIYRYFP